MAERRSITVKKSENPSPNDNNNNPFFFLSLIPKFLLKPFENLNKNGNSENGKSVKKVEKQEISDTKRTPDGVKFPRKKTEVSSVKLENDDVQEDTNPLILWQVYALGGFIILKWAWGKWQEKKRNDKKDSGEEQPPPPVPESVSPAPAGN